MDTGLLNDHVNFFIPLATSIMLALLLTLVLNMMFAVRR